MTYLTACDKPHGFLKMAHQDQTAPITSTGGEITGKALGKASAIVVE